ncbi:HK97 family phage prohead protease [Mesorhizobium sp. M2A.F.Ca.ET.067.02.1.1]|uniref:HK97 family phage prohead protease n=1 Tax=Mesorhizobium sp. M2A.F.Ca.ET.067.02.1.1 TaxID=2496749 RepID=UPI000FD36B2F|nr:HK97 family phage prohead protease [Mesorhizobium sp. M2A.F.Ca.ET.067.02.1.1]RUW81563.1 HK97 family phage prohead protease [Mesorhizobium sp. M2A.F.Ca.ET.067.02.1.1]TIU58007.1 MAG: HK97 family phage prohead protease [Mesorhizobium sp.]
MLYRKSSLSDRLGPALEVRFAATDSAGTIEGYASVFGGEPDSYGDVIASGAFKRSLAEMRSSGTNPLMLWSHDRAAPIGRWTDIREDDKGLLVKGQLNLATTRGKDAYEHLKHGDVSGLSIGFALYPNGSRQGAGSETILTDIDLREISVVALPANRRTRVGLVKSLNSKSDLVDMLRESGLSKSAAARVAAGGWSALVSEEQEKAAQTLSLIEKSLSKWNP